MKFHLTLRSRTVPFPLNYKHKRMGRCVLYQGQQRCSSQRDSISIIPFEKQVKDNFFLYKDLCPIAHLLLLDKCVIHVPLEEFTMEHLYSTFSCMTAGYQGPLWTTCMFNWSACLLGDCMKRWVTSTDACIIKTLDAGESSDKLEFYQVLRVCLQSYLIKQSCNFTQQLLLVHMSTTL